MTRDFGLRGPGFYMEGFRVSGLDGYLLEDGDLDALAFRGPGLGFGVSDSVFQVLGFRCWGELVPPGGGWSSWPGFGFQDSGFRYLVSGFRFQVSGFRCWVPDFRGVRVSGLNSCKVSGFQV